MDTDQVSITLKGLTPLQAEELRQELANAGIDTNSDLQIRPELGAATGNRKGEPFTMLAVLVGSQVALTALSIYLAKGRSRFTKKETVVISRNGESIAYTIDIASDQQEAIRAELMGKIAELRVPKPV